MFGNAVTTCSTTIGSQSNVCENARQGQTSGSSDAVNNVFYMDYIDIDSDASTFNSSSADYNFPVGSTVIWAGLYWSGDTSAGSNRSGVPSGVAAPDASKRNQMLLKLPGASTYNTITADNIDISGSRYSSVTDVTNLVKTAGSGTYFGANIQTGKGRDRYGGWTLIVVYEDPTETLRSMTIFDGFARVSGSNPINASLSGFLTPPSGEFDTAMGAITYEGDVGYRPDEFFLDGDGNDSDGDGNDAPFVRVGDSLNPFNNFFNSSNTYLGTRVSAKNPDYPNLLAMDMDIVNAVDSSGNRIMQNNATSAGLRFTSQGDVYYPTAFTFSVQVFQPVLTKNFTKTVTDINGGDTLPGDVLEYEISYNNTGNDAAKDVVIEDPIPGNTTFVPGSLEVVADPESSNLGTKTDAAGDDEAEFDGTKVIFRSGTGADGVNGGEVDINESITLRFRVKINSDIASLPTTISNQAEVDYKGKLTNVAFNGVSDDPATANANDPTNIEVVKSDNRPLGSPFTCDSTFYITIGNGGGPQQLYDIDRSGSTFSFIPRGTATNTSGGYPVQFDYNALAYNPVDNYLYGYINASDANDGPYSAGNVVKIGSDGVLHSLGKPTNGNGDALSGGFFAATILSDGTYVIGGGNKFATLDLTTTPPTITNPQTTISGVAFNDFAVDPKDPASLSGKRVYMVNESGSQDRLVILDMTSFPPQITSQATNPTGKNHNAGSQFVDAFGTLYYRSNTDRKLYRVNSDPNSPDYGKATEIATAPSGGNHDGASCLFAAAMEKEIQDKDGNLITEIPAGETVNYVYKIATGNVLDLNGVTFTDDLRSVATGSPVNGEYTGNITVSNGTGDFSFDNNNQTLVINNLTLPGQVANQDANGNPILEALTITAEVTIPKTTTPGTYNNQSFLTNLPAQYPPSIPSDYPRSPAFEDPTPVDVTEPIANNPNVLLVKRITKINDGTASTGGDNLAIYNQDNSNPYDDNKVEIADLPQQPTDPKPDTDKWFDTTSDTNSNFLIGGINGGKVKTDDELEYTIYFLSAGDSEAENVLICDRVPNNVAFIPTSFNNQAQAAGGSQGSDRGIMWLKDGQQESLTNTQDGDAAQYFPPGVEPSTVYFDANNPNKKVVDCGGANTNGAVVVNLGNLPNATAPGTPNTSYGYIRFRGRVK